MATVFHNVSKFTMVAIIAALSGAAISRNDVWSDSMVLWQDSVAKSPGKDRPHNNLGKAFLEHRPLEDSLGEYLTALRINPLYGVARNNLGYVYFKLGNMTLQ